MHVPVVGLALYEQVEGTRSRGRQAKKWMTNVKEDLTAQGMNVREAVANSRNRRTWRSLVEASSSEEKLESGISWLCALHKSRVYDYDYASKCSSLTFAT